MTYLLERKRDVIIRDPVRIMQQGNITLEYYQKKLAESNGRNIYVLLLVINDLFLVILIWNSINYLI